MTSAKRLASLPDVPAIAEFLPGYEANGWFGIGAPAGTPAPIIERLNHATNAVVADPDMARRLIDMGVQPMPMTAAAFAKFVAEDTAKWAKVAKFADIKAQ